MGVKAAWLQGLSGSREGISVWWVEGLLFLKKTSGVCPCGNVHTSVGIC